MKHLKTSTSLLLFILIAISVNAQNRAFSFAKTGSESNFQQALSDTSGNIYILGSSYTDFTYQGETITVTNDQGEYSEVYLLKTNATGEPVYLSSIQSGDGMYYPNETSIAVNQKGEMVLFMGIYDEESLTIANTTISLNKTTTKGVVVKISKNGYVEWSKNIDVTGDFPSITCSDVKLDENGSVYVCGSFNAENITIGNNAKLSDTLGYENMYLAKITDGNTDWLTSPQRNSTYTSNIAANNISLDADNNIYLAGRISTDTASFNFGEYKVWNIGTENSFIASYTTDGVDRWAYGFKSYMSSLGAKISTNSKGEAVATSFFNDYTVDIGSSTISNPDYNYCLAIAKISDNGDIEWTDYVNTNLSYVSSYSNESYVFLDDNSDVTLVNQVYDYFSTLVNYKKLKNPNSISWNYTTESTSDVWLNSVFFDNKGNVHFSGYTYNIAPFTLESFTINTDPDFPSNSINYWGKISENGQIEYFKPLPLSDTSIVSISTITADNYGACYLIGGYYGIGAHLGEYSLVEEHEQGFYIGLYNTLIDINGKVVSIEGAPIPEGEVTLITYTYKQESPISETTAIQDDGSYSFTNVPLGKYLLQASTDFQDDNTYLPTYYVSSGHWVNAEHLIATEPVNQNNAVVIMVPAEKMEGTSSISGTVTEVDDSDFKTTEAKPKRKGNASLAKGHPKSTIEIIAVTDIDENGYYSFGNVPAGDYTVYIEIPGIPHETVHEFSIPEGKDFIDIDYYVGEETIVAVGTTPQTGLENSTNNSSVKLYPNPSNGQITIELNENEILVSVSIQDIQGRVIQSSLQQDSVVQLTNIPEGIYFATITTESKQETIKFIVTP